MKEHKENSESISSLHTLNVKKILQTKSAFTWFQMQPEQFAWCEWFHYTSPPFNVCASSRSPDICSFSASRRYASVSSVMVACDGKKGLCW